MLAGSDHDALPPDTEVGGYLIESVLGQGGFGITYKAFNSVTGYRVAIKEFFPQGYARRTGGRNVTFLAREQALVDWAINKFRETTTALCRLKHPNIVTVTNYVSANETGYMIMELLEGRTFSDWLAERGGRATLEELRGVMDPVMAALGYVHGKGLVHRDVAPDNILVTTDGRPVLIDFGSVSKDLSERTSAVTGHTYRTYKNNFTAPEQRSTHLNPTSLLDVYSLGALLYLGLSGERPADSKDRLDEIFLHGRSDLVKPLAGFEPASCPPRAVVAIESALSMDRSKRPQSVGAFRDALGWGPNIEDPPPPPPPPPLPPPPPPPDSGWLTGLKVAAATGAVLVGLWILWAVNRPAPVTSTDPSRSTARFLRTFSDWSIYDQDLVGGRGCFAVVAGGSGSELFVLRLRSKPTEPEIFLRLGYDPTTSQRTLVVGGRSAALTLSGRKGALDAAASAPIVEAMKRANTISLAGLSGADPETFSGRGFTAALENMRTSADCP